MMIIYPLLLVAAAISPAAGRLLSPADLSDATMPFDPTTTTSGDPAYCYLPDKYCYHIGVPDCCDNFPCPPDKPPPCDFTTSTEATTPSTPDLSDATMPTDTNTQPSSGGAPYCFVNNTDCYLNGKPDCCQIDPTGCDPIVAPECDIGSTFTSSTTTSGAAPVEDPTGSLTGSTKSSEVDGESIITPTVASSTSDDNSNNYCCVTLADDACPSDMPIKDRVETTQNPKNDGTSLNVTVCCDEGSHATSFIPVESLIACGDGESSGNSTLPVISTIMDTDKGEEEVEEEPELPVTEPSNGDDTLLKLCMGIGPILVISALISIELW